MKLIHKSKYTVISLGILMMLSACAKLSAGCAKTLTGKATLRDGGTASLSGIVTFPTGTPSGLGYELMVYDSGVGYGVLPASLGEMMGMSTCGAGTLTYTVTNLEAGSYKILVRVQNAADHAIYDYLGYYAGTTAAPVTIIGSATAVDVTDGATLTGKDFGLGAAAAVLVDFTSEDD